ncbi:MAG: hypothetical protein IPG45_33955 [Deltaproteobacteria bacterium]|nr:hypothetical protein [Deltaproteobacteria bacterium]
MGTKIIAYGGMEHLDPRRFVPQPAERTVRHNFHRLESDRFLKGDQGFWEVSYQLQHPNPNPWRGHTREELTQSLDRALADAGLNEVIRGRKVDFVAAELTRVLVHLEMGPLPGADDQEIYRRLAAAWPHDQIPLPPMVLKVALPDQAGGGDLQGQTGFEALRAIFKRRNNGYVDVDVGVLGREQQNTLADWSKAVTPGGQRRAPALQLLALFGSDPNLSTEGGRRTIAALQKLGLYSQVWNEGLDLLAGRFAPDRLSRSMFLYNGHPTFAMTTLVPTLKAFGVAKSNLWLSQNSGTREALEIIKIQRPTAIHAERNFGIKQENGLRPKVPTIAQLLDIRLRMPQEDWDTHHLIVDKLGPWIQTLGNGIPRPVVEGRIRGIIHNRDDLDAIARHQGLLWGVDFANSQVKKLEATFIGEQFALMGAREARQKGWGRIGDLPVVINGFGLLGEQAAMALVRLGMPPERIEVRDLDPAALARAEAAGFGVESKVHDRAVVINATPGEGFGANTARGFGRDLIVLSMTSGGKGVDLPGLKHLSEVKDVPVTRASQKPIQDLDLTLRLGKEEPVQIRLIAEGWPPNLVDEMWADRYQVTSLGVSGATLLASELTEPGIVPFDPQLDHGLIALAERRGLLQLRPLEARPGEDPADLRADLDAFRPS